MTDYLPASGTVVVDGTNSFIVSQNQLVQMCNELDYKLFDPSGALYNTPSKELKYLTQDFKADCCGTDLNIAASLSPLFCD